ncbi:MAG TPA: DUF2721 domain-containing protein [Woeseiaceae bacterium]|nr:DUF2721 domain-containing protein [Woeseiaceae bacterium]
MEPIGPVNTIAAAIQLAIAPVFLLTGIGAILSVLTIRLGRVVDRLRLVQKRLAKMQSEDLRDLLHLEATALWRRIKTINWAMRLSVASALLICFVIVILFIGAYVAFPIGRLLASLFIAAMLLLIFALLLFLLEVSISTKRMLQGAAHIMADDDAR